MQMVLCGAVCGGLPLPIVRIQTPTCLAISFPRYNHYSGQAVVVCYQKGIFHSTKRTLTYPTQPSLLYRQPPRLLTMQQCNLATVQVAFFFILLTVTALASAQLCSNNSFTQWRDIKQQEYNRADTAYNQAITEAEQARELYNGKLKAKMDAAAEKNKALGALNMAKSKVGPTRYAENIRGGSRTNQFAGGNRF